MAFAAMLISLTSVMAENTAPLTSADLEVITEPAFEDALNLEEWMVEAPAAEKVIELQDWMIKPFNVRAYEAAMILEDWMFRFS